MTVRTCVFVAITAVTSLTHAADYGVGFGPFLPSKIGGVSEVMNGWAVRAGLATSLGFFETEFFNAHGDGANYNTVAFDYRLDVMSSSAMKDLPVFLLLGFHADSYSPTGTTSYRTSGGWHYGGGFRMPLGGVGSRFALRADFKQRFSPGTSLIVLIGFSFMTGARDSEKP
jgi:hypothetical protein